MNGNNDTQQKFDRLQSERQNSVLYPQGYTIAVLPSATEMAAVRQALQKANWQIADLIELSGPEFLAWHSNSESQKGALEKFMSLMAEIQGQETEYVKGFLELAQQNHHFVFIPTPEEADDQRMIEALRPFSPVKLSDYRPSGIVDLEIAQ